MNKTINVVFYKEKNAVNCVLVISNVFVARQVASSFVSFYLNYESFD